jgi:hypothetical protein
MGALAGLLDIWPDASTVLPTPGERIDLGGATLRVLSVTDGAQSRQFLQVEDEMLLTGVAPAADDAQARWIAPRHGFLRSRPGS